MALADSLLKTCGSLEEMCHEESLLNVKGLGQTIRQRIVETLTSEEEVKISRKSKS